MSAALFVSPHLDDAVFACAERIAASAHAVVVTVFAGFVPAGVPMTAWDRECGFAPADDVVALRRTEDAAALAMLGASPVWLDFRDDQYGEPRTTSEIAASLARVIEAHAPRAIHIPLGLFHADHRRANEAALTLVSGRTQWFVYADAIYRRIPGAVDARVDRLVRAGYELTPLAGDGGVATPQKREAIACYRSQLRALASRPGRDDVYAPERYWSRARPGRDDRRSGHRRGPHVQPAARGVANACRARRRGRGCMHRRRRQRLDRRHRGRDRGRFPCVHRVRLPRNAGATGRNAGARIARTRYVAFCDDDTWWLPGSLAIAARVLDAHPPLAAVTARVLVGAARREDPTSARMAASPLSNALGVEGSAILGLPGSACRVRRDAFLAVGGYEPRFFLGAEESLLAADLAAAGWRMAYVPAATVCHAPSPLRDNVARRRLEARNALWFACLRRPPAVVAKATLAWWKALRRDPHRTRALFDAMAGPAWVLRERRVLPPYVDQTLQSIESFYAARRKAKAAVPKLESTPS